MATASTCGIKAVSSSWHGPICLIFIHEHWFNKDIELGLHKGSLLPMHSVNPTLMGLIHVSWVQPTWGRATMTPTWPQSIPGDPQKALNENGPVTSQPIYITTAAYVQQYFSWWRWQSPYFSKPGEKMFHIDLLGGQRIVCEIAKSKQTFFWDIVCYAQTWMCFREESVTFSVKTPYMYIVTNQIGFDENTPTQIVLHFSLVYILVVDFLWDGLHSIQELAVSRLHRIKKFTEITKIVCVTPHFEMKR